MGSSFISKLLTELESKTTVSDTDLVPIGDNTGNLFKMTWKKIREYLLGETDISEIGDGTVTGAIDACNTGIAGLKKDAMQNPRLFDNMANLTPEKVNSTVPNWQVCGMGFKAWNDSYPVATGNSAFVFYAKDAMLAITMKGDIYTYNFSSKAWEKKK